MSGVVFAGDSAWQRVLETDQPQPATDIDHVTPAGLRVQKQRNSETTGYERPSVMREDSRNDDRFVASVRAKPDKLRLLESLFPSHVDPSLTGPDRHHPVLQRLDKDDQRSLSAFDVAADSDRNERHSKRVLSKLFPIIVSYVNCS